MYGAFKWLQRTTHGALVTWGFKRPHHTWCASMIKVKFQLLPKAEGFWFIVHIYVHLWPHGAQRQALKLWLKDGACLCQGWWCSRAGEWGKPNCQSHDVIPVFWSQLWKAKKVALQVGDYESWIWWMSVLHCVCDMYNRIRRQWEPIIVTVSGDMFCILWVALCLNTFSNFIHTSFYFYSTTAQFWLLCCLHGLARTGDLVLLAMWDIQLLHQNDCNFEAFYCTCL